MDKVLSAARKLFFTKGYLNTTVRDIALKAHFSTGVIYFYFKGKDDIYGRICEEGFQILTGLLGEAVHVHGTSLDRISSVVHAYLRFYTDYPQYFSILTFIGFRGVGLPVETANKLEYLSTQVTTMINEIVAEGINEGTINYHGDSLELTMLFWATLQGLISLGETGYLEKYGLDLAKLTNIQMELILKGVLAKPPLHPVSKG